MTLVSETRPNGAGLVKSGKRKMPLMAEPAKNKTTTTPWIANSVATIVDGADLMVSPTMAQALLDHYQHPKQRRYRDFHIADLAEEMKSGKFIAGTQIHFVRFPPNGKLQLVNNHHRLRAVIFSGLPATFRVLITPVKNQAMSDEMYRRLDRLELRRTTGDVILAEGIVEGQSLQREIASATFEAVKFIHVGFTKARGDMANAIRSDDKRLAACDEFWSSARLYQDAISEATRGLKGPLKSPSVMAVALVTLRHQPKLAFEFWTGVAVGGAGQRDPRDVLFRYLLSRTSNNPVDVMRAVSSAWNAFLDGRPLSVIRRNEQAVRIAGTPWAKTTI